MSSQRSNLHQQMPWMVPLCNPHSPTMTRHALKEADNCEPVQTVFCVSCALVICLPAHEFIILSTRYSQELSKCPCLRGQCPCQSAKPFRVTNNCPLSISYPKSNHRRSSVPQMSTLHWSHVQFVHQVFLPALIP